MEGYITQLPINAPKFKIFPRLTVSSPVVQSTVH